jgi:ATP-dependent Clp protease ATP-binding subunit ClpB
LFAATLAAGWGSGCGLQAVKNYLQSYPRETVEEKIDSLVKGYKLLTYVVHSNSAEVIQVLLEYGASLDLEDFSMVPLLARAIMQTKWTVQSSTEVAKILLTHGADPNCIPNDMWTDYIQQPNKTYPSIIKFKTDTLWCLPKHRIVLAETLHLTHRYLLWRANRMERPTGRMRQVAKAHKVQLLFGLPFMMSGQDHAAKLVIDTVFSEIVFPTSKPLVLAFAGPSGHGKTELATQMGHLLNVPWIDIDCAQTSTEFGLLGSTPGYVSSAEGSRLNNFLAGNANKRCVVFLDEFDKTTSKVREALLKVTDTGMTVFLFLF